MLKTVLGLFAIVGLLIGLLLISMPSTKPRRAISAITNVAVSSTGRWLASGTHDGHVVICERTTVASCTTVDTESGELNDLQFSPNERFLAIANSNIRLIALDDRQKSFFLRRDRRNYGTVRFDSASKYLLTINAQSEIELIDVESRVALKRFCCSSFYGEVAFFGGETQIVSAGHWPRIWSENGQVIKSLAANRQYETFRPIAVDEKRRAIYMGSQDGRVYEWSLDTFTLLKRSPAQSDYVDTIAIIPAIRTIAYCSLGAPLHLWNVVVDRDLELPDLRSSSNLIALPDGKSILFGTNSGTVEIWDLEGSPTRTFVRTLFRRH
jgi:WD40 repeat protein